MVKPRGKTKAVTTDSWAERIGWMLLMIFLWVIVFYIIFRVDPLVVRDIGIRNLYIPFIVVLMAAVWVTVGRWRHAWIKGFVWALSVAGFLLLRFMGLGHWLNLLLIGGFLISCEYYWRGGWIDKSEH